MIDKIIYGFGGMQHTSVCNPLMQCKMISLIDKDVRAGYTNIKTNLML